MNMEPEQEALYDHLARWEREKRLVLQIGGIVLFVSLCLVVRSTCLPSRPHTIEADRLILRDAQGVVRVQLQLDDQGQPRLQFFDPRGREQFGVRSLTNSSTEMAFSGDGLRRATLLTPVDGQASLEFNNSFFASEPTAVAEQDYDMTQARFLLQEEIPASYTPVQYNDAQPASISRHRGSQSPETWRPLPRGVLAEPLPLQRPA